MNALPRPNSEFLATPSVVCKPRTRSKHPKVALFEPAPRGPWGKKMPNMSTDTILVTGKMAQNGVLSVAIPLWTGQNNRLKAWLYRY